MSSSIDSNLIPITEKMALWFRRVVLRDDFDRFYTHKYKGKDNLYKVYSDYAIKRKADKLAL